ncbi:MAG: hypothetical protein JW720_16185 [Sedimentisphaerales bacterium]|nr:hypothetical protein [Sedimentisphaerales bacterium]
MMPSKILKYAVTLSLLLPLSARAESLWDTAKANRKLLKISTLFTAHNVRDYLAGEDGTKNAVTWCKDTGVTHVFIETFRDNYTAERQTLEAAKKRFFAEGFEVSGCVTPTRVGKISTGWNVISCYTDEKTQAELKRIFEYTASIFDEIMIDDFLFTDCQCDQCKAAKGEQPWAQYRCELMAGKVSRELILDAAKAVNPNAKIIIKYPQWYDNFHNRGYEVVRQSADYDKTWVGTETRNFEDPRWGGKVQYEAYYIMRWLGEIGGPKTGGGWFDPYGTTENTYLEQARQTVLADAKEMLLFCYGSLQNQTGPANVRALRREIPGLLKLAQIVRGKPIKGIMAAKPPNSDGAGEQYVYDFVGMLGLPLVPTATIDTDAKAAFFPVHSLKDPKFKTKLRTMTAAAKPLLITDTLAERLDKTGLDKPNVTILEVAGDPKNLLKLSRQQLRPIREKLLAPFAVKFDAPNKVALYLIGDNCAVVENFNDEPVDAVLELPQPANARKTLILGIDGEVDMKTAGAKVEFTKITPRTLVVIEY